MPGKDKTGPEGTGPLTGRGAGSCKQDFNGVRAIAGRGRGGEPRGGGRGAGRGLGRGRNV